MKTSMQLTIILGILFVNCNTIMEDIPSEEMARSELEKSMEKESEGLVKLTSFKKINGIEQEYFGVRVYGFEYSAEIEFARECWKPSLFGKPSFKSFSFTELTPSQFKKKHPLSGLSKSSFLHYEKGERVTFQGKINFEKAENGWRKR